MQNMVKAGCASVLLFTLGFLLALALLRYSPIAKVDENRVEEPVIPASNTVVNYTVADLPEGWKLYENQGQYRLKDPSGASRLPLMWFYGSRRAYVGEFLSIQKAVSDAIEYQQIDDFNKPENWKLKN